MPLPFTHETTQHNILWLLSCGCFPLCLDYLSMASSPNINFKNRWIVWNTILNEPRYVCPRSCLLSNNTAISHPLSSTVKEGNSSQTASIPCSIHLSPSSVPRDRQRAGRHPVSARYVSMPFVSPDSLLLISRCLASTGIEGALLVFSVYSSLDQG